MFNKVNNLTLLFLLFSLVFPTNIFGAVLINEISPSTNTEWVELYNDGESEVNLNGYLLEDGNSSKTDDLSLSGTISAKGFLVFTHNEGWLNNGGDSLKLYNNASPAAIIDQYTYGTVESTKSVARIPNGSENWQITSSVTNNSSNPNPTAAPTQNPTNQPTTQPTATSTPTSKPLATKTATPKPTSTPTEEAEESSTPDSNVIETERPNAPSPTGVVAGASTSRNSSKAISITLIFLGICFLGYCAFLIYNGKNAKDKNTS